MSRHSIKNVLRLVRGARNALQRTAVRYGRQTDVRLRLEHLVRRAVNEAEKQLRFALRDAKAARERNETKRRAA